jgi:hypothetical protein
VIDHTFQYILTPYLLLQENGEFQSFLFFLMVDTAYVNDVARCTAVSCILPFVALCATEIESLNMTHIWFFMQNFFGTDVHMVFG